MKDSFDRLTYKPVEFNKKNYKPVFVVDQIKGQLEELFLIRNPKHRFNKDYKKEFREFSKNYFASSWFYYPWLKTAVKVLAEDLHQELRTARNRYLITEPEQKKYYNARVGILGLSVGSHAALTLALTGGAKYLKLADPDEISLSNLNRIRAGVQNIGLNKAIAVSRQVYEINPYAEIEVYKEGATKNNLEKFLLEPRLDILMEEMDNPPLKIKIRELAKKHKIPVIMAADNGDNIVVDVERYDLNSKLPILHGLAGKLTAEDMEKLPPPEFLKLIAKLAAAELNTVRMLESVMEVGKSIYSWPQLGNAATLCGSVLAYLARKIILGEAVKTGRIDFSVDNLLAILPKNYQSEKQKLLKKMFSK